MSRKKTPDRLADELNIKFCDFLLSQYQYDGRFKREDLRNKRTNLKPTAAEEKIYTDAGRNWFDNLTGFMIQNGYFFDNEAEKEEDKEYVLTARGNLAKELGGVKKYQRYHNTDIWGHRLQPFINWGLVIATVLAGVMPFVAEKCNKKPTIIYIIQQGKSLDQSKSDTAKSVRNVKLDTLSTKHIQSLPPTIKPDSARK